LRKNRPAFYAEISTTLLYDENNKPTGFIGVTEDITKRKRAEAALYDFLKKSFQKYSKMVPVLCR
jgi:hypothetical protein